MSETSTLPAPPAAPGPDRSPDDTTRRVWARLGRTVLRDLFAKPDRRYGYDPARLREVLAELDARTGLGTTLAVCVQTSNALPLLLGGHSRAGAPGPAGSVVEDLLDGTAQIAVAATDAAAPGSDLAALGTTVRFDADGAVLTGGKRWVVGATTADWALVLARHAPGRRFTSFTLLLVPLDAPGVTRRPADTRAFQGAGLGDLHFSGVRLDARSVIGGRGRGLALFARQLAGERLAGALWAEALTGRVLAETRGALRERRIADLPLWHNAAVRQSYARAVVAQQTLQALCDRLCRPHPGPVPPLDEAAAQAAVAKTAGAETVESVLSACAQLAGADGFRSGGIQQLRAEAAMFGIAGGSTPLLLDLIADHADILLPAASEEGTR